MVDKELVLFVDELCAGHQAFPVVSGIMHVYLLLVSHDDSVSNVHFLLLHDLVFLFLSLDLLGHFLPLQARLLVEIQERFLLL